MGYLAEFFLVGVSRALAMAASFLAALIIFFSALGVGGGWEDKGEEPQ